MCGQQVYVAIGDPNQKTLAEYQSDPKLNFAEYDQFEVFDNNDYDDLANRYINNKQYE